MRLDTVAKGSAVLAVVALAAEVAHIYRAVEGVLELEMFTAWQRPFVDGPSMDGAYVGLASLVLLLMLPVSDLYRSARRLAVVPLAAAALLNVALGVGYAVVSAIADVPDRMTWVRPSLVHIVLHQLPCWGLAVVVLFVLLDNSWGHVHPMQASRPLARRRSRPELPRQLAAQLAAVAPSTDGAIDYRPCRVTLDDGSVRDRVYVQRSDVWFDQWGVDPEDDPGKELVPIDTVVAIEESPSRLPPRFASQMYAAGESAMGGCVFQLVLRNGRRLDCSTGNAVDFIDWPPGTGPHDVVELVPHQGRTGTHDVKGAAFAWSLYDEG